MQEEAAGVGGDHICGPLTVILKCLKLTVHAVRLKETILCKLKPNAKKKKKKASLAFLAKSRSCHPFLNHSCQGIYYENIQF